MRVHGQALFAKCRSDGQLYHLNAFLTSKEDKPIWAQALKFLNPSYLFSVKVNVSCGIPRSFELCRDLTFNPSEYVRNMPLTQIFDLIGAKPNNRIHTRNLLEIV
jgi:hypothetical protein